MAQHVFDRNGRQVGTILNDDELPQRGCGCASIILGIIFIILVIGGVISHKESGELPYQNVTYMRTSYEKNAEFPRGTWCQCPVCDEYFYKDNLPCCSQKCEREYHDIVHAWERGDREFVEQHGKKFK